MLGFDAVAKLSLGGLPASGTSTPFSYTDWRTHSPKQTSPEFAIAMINLLPGLLSQPGLVFGTVSIPNLDHPPPYVKGAEFIFPNIAIASFVRLQDAFVPEDFYRHPPPYVRGPDPIFPNFLLNLEGQPSLQSNYVPYDFYRHPPCPPKGPDTVFPNLMVTVNAIPVLQFNFVPYDFYRHPPPVKLPDPPFLNVIANLRASQPGLQLTIRPFEFNRHPPPFVKAAEFVFPNLVLEEISVPPAPIPSSVNQRIRHANYVVQQIRDLGRVLYR